MLWIFPAGKQSSFVWPDVGKAIDVIINTRFQCQCLQLESGMTAQPQLGYDGGGDNRRAV